MVVNLKEELKGAIIRVLSSDSRPMTLNFLMHKVFKDLSNLNLSIYVHKKDFSAALDELTKKYWVGRTKHSKYFIDYLDYEETDVSGEGYLELDEITGHGYITLKRNFKEYKKPSYFVHKKNTNGAKWGDYVQFVELNNTRTQKTFYKDAAIKKILPKPKILQ